MKTIKLIVISPAIFPSIQGLTISKANKIFDLIKIDANTRGIDYNKGKMGEPHEEFNLYTDITEPGANYREYYILKFKIPEKNISIEKEKEQPPTQKNLL